jgi:hypothetical protein
MGPPSFEGKSSMSDDWKLNGIRIGKMEWGLEVNRIIIELNKRIEFLEDTIDELRSLINDLEK